jgi:hypothetical protein
MEGEEEGAIRRGVTGTGTHERPSFGNLTMVARPYCCSSGIIGQLVRDYN